MTHTFLEYSARLFVYAGILLFVINFSRLIIYPLILTTPFYGLSHSLFIDAQLFGVHFTIKPFLFVVMLLAVLSLKDFVKDRFSFKGYTVPGKSFFALIVIFCILAFLFSRRIGGEHVTEINMMINATLVLLLPYYYRNTKINLCRILSCFAFTTVLIAAHYYADRKIMDFWNNSQGGGDHYHDGCAACNDRIFDIY